MSQHQIEPYEPMPLVSPPGATAPSAASQNLTPLWTILRRRWRFTLAVALCLAIPAALTTLLRVKPTYTASAQVQVKPMIDYYILYQDDATRSPLPLYDAYLNTQAELMASSQVFHAALADPELQGLPLVKQPEAAGKLRSSILIKRVPLTHLLQVEVTRPDPDSALRLAKAVLNAYMTHAVQLEAKVERTRREELNRKQQETHAELDRQTADIMALAGEYGTASEKTFDILREGMEKYTLEARQELARAELDVLQLEQELRQLTEGGLPADMSTDQQARREQMIAEDGGVRYVRQQLETTSSQLARLRSFFPADHRDVLAAQQKLTRLQANLNREVQRAEEDVDRQLAARREDQVKGAKTRLSESLLRAKYRCEQLAERVRQQEERGKNMGNQGLEIQRLKEDKETTKAQYDRVTQELQQIEAESRRPARIEIAALPDIRPDGIKDRRVKYAAISVAGSLMFAVALALLRHRLDSHLQDTNQVAAGMGLDVLGSVPSIRELRAGLVSREDFLESYRCIRTAIAGAGDGSVPKSILITSAQAGEGKTSLAVSLSASLAEPGVRVLLIDGDVQAPQIGRLLRLPPRSDLTSVLNGERSLEEAVRDSSIPQLHVLTSNGKDPNTHNTLTIASAGRLLRQAAAAYDCVVVDSPPALGAADASVWAHVVDKVILSSVIGRSDVNAIRLARQRLRFVGAKLLGIVIANVPSSDSVFSYSSCSVSGQRPSRTPPIVHLPERAA